MFEVAIVLVKPQMGENIGAVARAMKNCGLSDLRLVAPRDGWPNERAVSLSSGATDIIENAQLFDTTRQALADCTHIYATTARERDMNKVCLTPQTVAQEIKNQQSAKHALLFGCERTGLENEDIALADAIVSVPLNPEFSSLNLAQAVLLISYQIYSASPAHERPQKEQKLAEKEKLYNLFDHFEEELVRSDFFKNEDMKPSIMQNIQNMFLRARLSEQEVQTLHGMIVSLTGRKRENKQK